MRRAWTGSPTGHNRLLFESLRTHQTLTVPISFRVSVSNGCRRPGRAPGRLPRRPKPRLRLDNGLYRGGYRCPGISAVRSAGRTKCQQGTSWCSSLQEWSLMSRAVKVSGPVRLTATLSIVVPARVARSCTMTSSAATIVDRSHIFSVRESVNSQFMSVLSLMESNAGTVPNPAATLKTEAPRTARANGTRSLEEGAYSSTEGK